MAAVVGLKYKDTALMGTYYRQLSNSPEPNPVQSVPGLKRKEASQTSLGEVNYKHEKAEVFLCT